MRKLWNKIFKWQLIQCIAFINKSAAHNWLSRPFNWMQLQQQNGCMGGERKKKQEESRGRGWLLKSAENTFGYNSLYLPSCWSLSLSQPEPTSQSTCYHFPAAVSLFFCFFCNASYCFILLCFTFHSNCIATSHMSQFRSTCFFLCSNIQWISVHMHLNA